MATGTTLLDDRQVRKAVAHDAPSETSADRVEAFEDPLRPDNRRPAGRRVLVVVAVAVITAAAAFAVQTPLGLGPVDDAYISLRYAVNWASGNGLCFNIGERVEGYTNFLLVAIQAGLIRLGIPPMTVMSWVPVAALGLLSGVVAWFASRQIFPSRLAPAAVAGLVIGLNPLLVCWAAGGLETTLYALLLTTTAVHVAGRDGPAAPIASACLLSLCAMARPEAAMLCPVLAFFVYLKDRSLRDTVRFALTFGIGFGAYFALRAWHFGQLFPNTFYAKLDYGNSDLAWRGLEYVAHFALAIWPVTSLCLVAVLMRRSAPRWASVFAAVITTQLAVVAYEGGDHFAMFRFAAPVTPLMGLLALRAVTTLAQRRGSPRMSVRAVLAAGLAAVALSGFLAGRAVKRDEPDSVTQYLRFLQESDYARQWTAIGKWLSRNAEPDSSIATVAIGAVGFYSDMRLVDPHGLIDPAIAHAAGNLGTGYAGHEKFDVQRVLSQRPGYVLLINHLSLEPIPHDSVSGNLWGQFAPRLHRDPRFARQYRYEQVPIAGRWLNVHVRRDLPRLPTPQFPDA